jgi:hypothetical protein
MKKKTITLFKENQVKFVATQQKSLILKAKRIVHDVYVKSGYLSRPLPSRMFPEERIIKSTYLLAFNKTEIIGILRVSPVKDPLQFFKDWELKISLKTKKKLEGLKNFNCRALENLVVKENYRNKKISGGLYKAAWLLGLIKEIDYYLIKMDFQTLESLKKLGWYVEEIAPAIFYLGSLTVPAILPLKKQIGSVFKKNPDYFSYLIGEKKIKI